MRGISGVVIGLLLALQIAGPVRAQPAAGQPQPIASPAGLAEGFGIQLLEAPADLADDPRARSYVIDHVAPGATIERRILVLNNTPDAAQYSLYAGASAVTDGGWTPAEGREQNELTGWISLTPVEGRLGPTEQVEGVMRITVPDDVRPGERYAVLWAERGAPADVPAGQVGLTSRVGIRVYLSVGEGDGPTSDFSIDSLTAITRTDGVAVVRAQVTNTGERALDLGGVLQLADGPGGLSTGALDVPPTTLRPDGGIAIEVEVGREFPAGPWSADLELRSGSTTRQATALLTFPEQPGEAEPTAAEPAGDGARPALIATAVVLQLAVGGTAIRTALRRRS